MLHLSRSALVAWLVGTAIVLTGCAGIPSSGPSSAQIGGVADSQNNPLGIQVVDLTDEVARKLHAERSSADFSTVFGDRPKFQQQLGIGDTIEVSIWEAPPATLFGAAQVDARSGPSNARVTVLPDQMIDSNGNIDVPFIGAIKASGRTPVELQQQIARKLRPIAHDPQVLVKLSRNVTSYVTVVGDVASSNRMQLTPRG
ncbi:polysaccharide biosynthesis/export family protein, partial [Burkholderia cenocepacia]